ncbi:unnamed protein product [Fraxinus pennsylvanica]|uniref:TF-B3 domain-containing protein n=1 Tax=Fraxinus pennsylvanica TaxID=56036 RepID=A0AAD2EDG6_9LAMI|nr:unnamed protein product [Fraxinus pennsylvanica]
MDRDYSCTQLPVTFFARWLSGCDKEGLGHFHTSVEDKNKDGPAEAKQVADDGARKEDDVESNEDLYYMQSEDDEIKMVKTVNFFKCYNPTTSTQRLELPAVFRLQLQGDLPESAFLRDCYTNLWPIKMAKIGNDCFFWDGWEKFVEDNSLESGDVLVFQYDGDNLFDVKLLGLSGCDKEGLGHFHTSVEDKNKGGPAEAKQVADAGARKEDDVESNEDLYYMESEDDGEEGIHDSDDNAKVYKEIMEVQVEDTEDEDDTEKTEYATQEDGEADAEQMVEGRQCPLNSYVASFACCKQISRWLKDNELLQVLQSYNQRKQIGTSSSV